MIKEKELGNLNVKTPKDEIKYRIGQKFGKQGVDKNGNTIAKSARMLAYVDARYVMEKLDQVVGSANWSNAFHRDEKGMLYCTITITFERKDGVADTISKTDVGTESNVEQQKGEVSDAFKRCAVHFGLARDLYVLPKDPWSMVAELDPTGRYLSNKNWKPQEDK